MTPRQKQIVQLVSKSKRDYLTEKDIERISEKVRVDCFKVAHIIRRFTEKTVL